ncbi:hypothetical protein EGH21_02960 [Halomicroarcula sp. F13]|uniref:DUF7282 domain-containing protein n=1 Tax=Haloarcula rubra TaxID=2487747 RepID=A0AAW4PLG7_9EURY|nr:hypothetical protein [Halomicroarcula rubra]MBX0321986.1 hypothetical protein [Halomicroarcula rubra]
MQVRTLSVLLVVLVAASGVATAHGNDVVVHSQRSSNGVVQVAHVSQITSAHLVLHRTDGATLGPVVGHRYLSHDGPLTERDHVTVRVEPSAWANVTGNRTLFAALHTDDGDGRFDPESDAVISRDGEPVGHQFVLGKADGNASVVAHEQTVATNVTVENVAIDADGYLVASAHDGHIAGVTPLAAGRHENVTVGLDPAFYNDQRSSFELELTLYHDDGDGTFDPATDTPVTAGTESVGTHLAVEKATPTVTTPVTTTTDGSPTGATTTAPPTDSATATTSQTTGGSGSGFGVLAAALAVVSAVLLRERRH